MTISNTAKAQVFAQEGGGFLELLTISHETLAEPLRFVNNTENVWKSAVIGFDVDRASTKWAANLAGTWSEFLADVGAITDAGISLEVAGVNGQYNNGLSGTVAGSPGTVPTGWGAWVGNGLTRLSVALATDHGLPCVDIETGGTPSTGTSIAAALGRTGLNAWPVTPGDTIYGSAFLAVIGGSFVGPSNFLRMTYYDAAGANLTQVDIPINTLGSTLTRVDTGPRVVPASAAFAVMQIRIGYTVGVLYNLKMRIGGVQIEKDRLSSPIIGTGTTQTRAADALTLPLNDTTADLVATFDDNSTQIVAAAVDGDYIIDPATLNRSTVKRFDHGLEYWDFAEQTYVDPRGGDMYIAFPFRVTLPKEKDRAVPTAQLEIDNVSREIGQIIRQISTPPSIDFEIVRIDNIDVTEVSYPTFKLRNVEYDALTVSGELTVEDMMREPYPQRSFSPSEYPGVH